MAADGRTAGDLDPKSTTPRQTQSWTQANAGFLRAVLLIVTYCSAVISLIATIAFRGINVVSIITGTLCIIAVISMFLLPSSRRAAR